MQEIVYKIPGKQPGPEGKTYDWKPVRSDKELKESLKDGWFNTLEEAVKATKKRARNDEGEFAGDDPATPEDEAHISEEAPTRAEMKAKAEELGIQFAKNISSVKLLALIEKKLAEN